MFRKKVTCIFCFLMVLLWAMMLSIMASEQMKEKMKKTYFTITGTNMRYGTDFLKADMKVTLEKEPDNDADNEAIKVTMPGLGTVGYVANSVRTRIGESASAGRIFDKIGDTATGTVVYVMGNGVLCTLDEL